MKLMKSLNDSLFQFINPPRITSNIVILLFSANILISGFLTPVPSNREIEMSWHWIDFTNAVISAASLIFLKSYINERKNSGLIFKITFIFGACIPGIIVTPLIIQLVTNKVPMFIYFGIPVGIISNIMSLITFTIIVVLIGDSRRSLKQVKEIRTNLRNYTDTFSTRVKKEREEILLEVRKTVYDVVHKLESKINQLNKNKQMRYEVIDSFKHDIDNIIRPLSYKINTETTSLSLISTPSVYTFSTILEIFKNKINLQIVINPMLLGANLVNIVLLSYFFLFDLKAMVFVGLPAFLISILLIIGIRFLFKNRELNLISTLILVFFTSISVTSVFSEFNKIMGKQLDSSGIITINRGAFLVTFIILIVGILLAMRAKLIEEAESLNSDLFQTLSSIRHNLLAIRKEIARNLHGEIQGHLRAALLRLASAPELSFKIQADIKEDLRKTLAALAPKSLKKRPKVMESLLDTKDSWSGICEIELLITKDVIEKLDTKPFARECALEVINEAVANAVKHGDASKVKVEAQIVKEVFVELKISNNISQLNVIKDSSGMGHIIMEEVSQSWNIEIIDSQYVLTSYIHLNNTLKA